MPKLCNNIYNDFVNQSFNYFNLNKIKTYYNSNIDYVKEIPLGNTDVVNIPIYSSIKIRWFDIIFTKNGQVPSTDTKGFVGSCLYNIYNLRKWECKNIKEENGSIVYKWEEQVFSYNEKDNVVIHLLDNYYEDKNILINIYDFRYELLYNCILEAKKEIQFDITEEISSTYFNKRGNYYCEVILLDKDNQEINTVISPDNFIIVIV